MIDFKSFFSNMTGSENFIIIVANLAARSIYYICRNQV